jgi:hypothetical protein
VFKTWRAFMNFEHEVARHRRFVRSRESLDPSCRVALDAIGRCKTVALVRPVQTPTTVRQKPTQRGAVPAGWR